MIIILGGSSSISKTLLPLLAKKNKIICFFNKNKPKIINKNVSYIKFNLENNSPKILFKNILLKNIGNENITLINFATVKIDKLSLSINNNEMKKTFNVNFFSFFKIIQLFLPKMIAKKWGRIINVSSTGGLRGDKGTMLYTSSKHASLGMFKTMSKEYARYNISFNTLKLGNFNFGLFKKLSYSKKKEVLANVPSNKTGDIKNIFNAINFIIDSDYVNNSEINIDGGM